MVLAHGLVLVALLTALDRAPLHASVIGERIIGQIESGKVPEAKLGQFAAKLCEIGDGDDLAWLLSQVADEKESKLDAHRQTLLTLLMKSDKTPSGKLDCLARLFQSQEVEICKSALQLARKWKVEGLTESLESLASAADTPAEIRYLAQDALAEIAPGVLSETARRLAGSPKPDERRQGFLLLLKVDINEAAGMAIETLLVGDDETAREFVLEVARRKQGVALLSEHLADRVPPKGAAERVLYAALAAGLNLEAFEAKLRAAVGVGESLDVSTPALQQAFLLEVAQQGDAEIGERLFHQERLNCQKCHSLGGVGGTIGPDLASVGVSSPPDYILRALIHPSADIKESFRTLKVVTIDGELVQGMLVSEREDAVVLKDAEGKERTIAKAEIEEQNAGESLMPQGLPGLLTRVEFRNLIRFLTELGKEGRYQPPSPSSLRKYQAASLPESIVKMVELADWSAVDQAIAGLPESAWAPVYAYYSGAIDASTFDRVAAQGRPFVLLADVKLLQPGQLHLQSPLGPGCKVVVDGEFVNEGTAALLTQGAHRVAVLFDSAPESFSGFHLRALEGHSQEFEGK